MITIFVSGGVVNSVYSDTKELVTVIDEDNLKEGGTIDQYNSMLYDEEYKTAIQETFDKYGIKPEDLIS